MQQYIRFDENGYLVGVGDDPFRDGLCDLVEVPDDLDLDQMDCYRYTEGKFEYDKAKWAARQREQIQAERRQRREQGAVQRLQVLQAQQVAKAATTTDDVIAISPLLPGWIEGKYAIGDIVTYEDAPYRCVQAHDATGNTSWNPQEAVSLWANYHAGSEEYALPWAQPTGAHDAYQAGEWMIWTDGMFYHCKMNNTVLDPDTLPGAWEAVNDMNGPSENQNETPENANDPVAPEQDIAEWAQPQPGLTSSYMRGDVVRYNGALWASHTDNNVWAPGVYGWDQV